MGSFDSIYYSPKRLLAECCLECNIRQLLNFESGHIPYYCIHNKESEVWYMKGAFIEVSAKQLYYDV